MTDQVNTVEVNCLLELCINNSVYEVVNFLNQGEKCLPGEEMIVRARSKQANMNQSDGEFLLENQYQIPDAFRGAVIFCFPGWTHSECSEIYFLIYFNKTEGRWVKAGAWENTCCDGKCRLIRLK